MFHVCEGEYKFEATCCWCIGFRLFLGTKPRARQYQIWWEQVSVQFSLRKWQAQNHLEAKTVKGCSGEFLLREFRRFSWQVEIVHAILLRRMTVFQKLTGGFWGIVGSFGRSLSEMFSGGWWQGQSPNNSARNWERRPPHWSHCRRARAPSVSHIVRAVTIPKPI